MTVKASKSAQVKNGKAIGFGDRVEKSSQNFIGGNVWMQAVKRGTLKINPELADKSLEDILTDGGLNFQVLKVGTTYKSPVSGLEYPSESYSIIRADNDYELGRGFSSDYSPISYPDLLGQFFEDTTKLGGVPTRALSFDNGAVGAIQFAFGDGVLVADRPHKTFFNLIASHNGQYSVITNECDVCIICGNTFAHNVASKDNRFSVKHTKNMNTKLAELQRILVQSESNQKYYYQLLDKAATVKADNNLIQDFLKAMYPDGKPNANNKINQGPANQREQVYAAIANTAAERNTSDLTIYDVFQGQLRYASYKQGNRNDDEQWMYAMKSQNNQDAYAWLVEAVK